jgi:hypothetical protein
MISAYYYSIANHPKTQDLTAILFAHGFESIIWAVGLGTRE